MPWAVQVPSGYRVGRWEVTRGIASGAWGSVYAASSLPSEGPDPSPASGDAEEAALKFIPTGTATPRLVAQIADMVRREVDGLIALRHERLVTLLEILTVDDPDHPELDGSVVLVMELAAGSLTDLLQTAEGRGMPDGPRYLTQLAEALDHIHGQGWVHGDLKPSNVLIRPNGESCLADFGLAAALDGTHAYLPPLVSPDFAPPERRAAHATTQGQRVRPSGDMWAFGVVAAVVLTGRMPFPGETTWARSRAVAEYAAQRRPLTLPDQLSPLWRGIVLDCLAPDPERRPTALQIVRRIQHDPKRDSPGPRPFRRRRTVTLGVALGVIAVTVASATLATIDLGPSGGGARTAAVQSTASRSAASPAGSQSISASVPSVPAGGCAPAAMEATDVVTKMRWHRVWYCHNRTGVAQYAAPDGRTVIGWLVTRSSWFICYRWGTTGPGKRDVWYYTQGDLMAAGWESRQAWGYVPAASLEVTSHPFPGIPVCPEKAG